MSLADQYIEEFDRVWVRQGLRDVEIRARGLTVIERDEVTHDWNVWLGGRYIGSGDSDSDAGRLLHDAQVRRLKVVSR